MIMRKASTFESYKLNEAFNFDNEYFLNDDDFARTGAYTQYKDAVGVLAHKGARPIDYYFLFKLDSFDKKVVKDVKLKSDEMIFRYETDTTKIGKMRPLIKINLKRGLVYFIDNDHFEETNEVVFEPKGSKVHFMKLRRNDFVKPTDEKFRLDGFDKYRGYKT